jgi:MoxR-like ATPase
MTTPPGAARPDDALLEEYAAVGVAIEDAVRQVIVGQDALVRELLVCLLCEGHVLLEGAPGLGKTELLKALAAAVDLDHGRIQFTPDLMPADIVGTQVLEERERGRREFVFRAGPVFTNLLLADEVNRATPKSQSALLEAMQERTVTVAGETRQLARPFMVMATQNPIELEGTYPLPEAQLDRFLLKATVPFPGVDVLEEILRRTTKGTPPVVRPVVSGDRLLRLIALTRQVPVATHLLRHAAEIVLATHPGEAAAPDAVRRYVRHGASPRAGQALVLAAKASALLDGRAHVSGEDLRRLAVPAIRHRLVLGYEAIADGVSADAIVAAVLDAVPEPRVKLLGAP